MFKKSSKIIILTLIFVVSLTTGLIRERQKLNDQNELILSFKDSNNIPLNLSKKLFEYIDSNPIDITSDSSFQNYDFPGSGTITDPFIISGLNITKAGGTRLISIENTTVHFIIENNYLNGLNFNTNAISLTDVANAQIKSNKIEKIYTSISLTTSTNIIIENNEIGYNFDAIILDRSNNNRIKNNKVENIESNGISLAKSSYNIVENNKMVNLSIGVNFFDNSHHNSIVQNKISNTNGDGVQITPKNANYNLVEENILKDNGESGIRIWSNNNRILGNTILRSILEGIQFDIISNNNTVLNNTIANCLGYGISLSSLSVTNTTAKFNIFINNSLNYPLQRQANDNGVDNLFAYNYWSDLAIFDYNNDSINDIPYNLDGNADNDDLTPLTFQEAHVLTDFFFIVPSGNEILSGVIEIIWTPSQDSMLHPLIFSLLYSLDNGSSWSLIATNISGTSFNWDTSVFATDLSNVTLKLTASDNFGLLSNDVFSDIFSINNHQSPLDPLIQIIITVLSLLLLISLVYLFYYVYMKTKYEKNFDDIFTLRKIELVKSIYNKTIIGLENCKSSILDIPNNYSLPGEIDESYGMINYFPIEYQSELKSKLKGRSILVLIELAYLYPSNLNPKDISKILSIPKSSLSDELRKLKELDYIKTEIDLKMLSDGRFRNYSISQKGFNFLYVLKEVLKVSLEGKM